MFHCVLFAGKRSLHVRQLGKWAGPDASSLRGKSGHAGVRACVFFCVCSATDATDRSETGIFLFLFFARVRSSIAYQRAGVFEDKENGGWVRSRSIFTKASACLFHI